MARPSDVSHDRARSVQHVLVKQLWVRLKTSPGRQRELDLSEIKSLGQTPSGNNIAVPCGRRAMYHSCRSGTQPWNSTWNSTLELNNDKSGRMGSRTAR